MLVQVDDGGLGNGVGLALPLANALVLWVEASALGRLGMVDLNVLAPLVGLGVPHDAHAAWTLAGTSVAMELGEKRQRQTVTNGYRLLSNLDQFKIVDNTHICPPIDFLV